MSEKVKIEAKPLEIRPGSSAPSPAGSAGSPPAPRMKLAPKLELKPSARGGLLDGPVQQIVTSKEWVLPPRPKPGRKPSSDTPPSKRKAQNRAAQRAFRERRAQRVSELEDKLQEVESERDAQENVLKDALKDVSSENQLLRESLEALRREVMSIKEQRTPSGSATPGGQSPGFAQQAPPPPHHQVQGPHMNAGLPPPPGRGPPPPAPQQSYYPSYSPYHMPSYSPHQVTSPMATMEPTSPFPGSHHRNSFGSFSFQGYGGPYSPRYEYSNPASPSEHTTVATSVGDPSVETLDRVLETKMSTSKVEPRVQETSNATSSTSVSVASLTNETAKKCVPATSGGHEVDPDCIICTKEECACAAIGQQKAVMGHSNDDDEIDFTTFKPQAAVPLKRKSLEMEMDFTAAFKTRNPFKKRKDSCGFCTDGTPCLCEDAAAESVAESKKSLKLPPLGMPLSPAASAASPDAYTSGIGSPWDQEGDRERSDKKRKRSETKVSDNPGCTGNPGTCMQCQSDPMSTLFCTTVASRKQSATRSTLPEVERERVDTPPPKSLAPIKALSPAVSVGSSGYSPSTQVGGTYIPCSAAYQTLSRHKDFNRVDLGTLIGKLNTRGTQVEVSSVANVLRELDRKFYE
ncbi:hypothetical protein CJU90_0450 [Yarrowia sp. C11]|nr:hypothetical protein CKK34_1861 [Yarrowia sp. E02]KAG5372796.1 hypothetical protein CJU90_0450 [Yarrowia sp. C11]